MSEALKRFQNTIPKSLAPETNRVLLALLTAIASSDDNVADAIEEGKKQLFVRTATGKGLDKIAASLGVDRPRSLGLFDEDFQNLVPNLSLKPKTIRKAFYDTADIFWGPLFSRANITSANSAPFNVSTGDIIYVQIDNGPTQTVKVLTNDLATDGAATALEIQTILSKINNVTISIIEDPVDDEEFINIRTNTPGSVGCITILESTMLSSSKLDFTVGSYDILDLDQRVAVYNLEHNKLVIEIPAIIPALRRTLKGSHHFHEDATLEEPQPTANGTWVGSFLFNPTGSVDTSTVTSQRCELQQTITKGQVYTSIAVDDNSLFEETNGEIIFGFGTNKQEGPVKYRGVPNSSALLIDPGHTFLFTHVTGEMINVISSSSPYSPARSGKDYAVYLTSPSSAREDVQTILESLAAAGVLIEFIILAPDYKYLIDNPYISSDDAPESE